MPSFMPSYCPCCRNRKISFAGRGPDQWACLTCGLNFNASPPPSLGLSTLLMPQESRPARRLGTDTPSCPQCGNNLNTITDPNSRRIHYTCTQCPYPR